MTDYEKKTIEELNDIASDKKEELEKVTQDIIRGKEKNVMKVKQIRKEIARVKTAISLKKKEVIKEDKNA